MKNFKIITLLILVSFQAMGQNEQLSSYDACLSKFSKINFVFFKKHEKKHIDFCEEHSNSYDFSSDSFGNCYTFSLPTFQPARESYSSRSQNVKKGMKEAQLKTVKWCMDKDDIDFSESFVTCMKETIVRGEGDNSIKIIKVQLEPHVSVMEEVVNRVLKGTITQPYAAKKVLNFCIKHLSYDFNSNFHRECFYELKHIIDGSYYRQLKYILYSDTNIKNHKKCMTLQ